MKIIPVGLRHQTIVDDSDFTLLNQFAWYVKESHKKVLYAVTGRKKVVCLHNLILLPPDGFEVDHIDGNGLNNIRSNLRLATRAQQCQNRGMFKNNSTGVKGVTQCGSKWRARILANHKSISLGTFGTKEEAAEAYRQAAIKYHGEYSRR